MNKEQFVKKAKKIYGDIYDYSLVEYINSSTKVRIICQTHGEFEQIPKSHLLNHRCNKCSVVSRTNKNSFIENSTLINGNNLDYSKTNYINNYTKIKFICKTHNIEFEQTPESNLKGSGCKICKRTNGSTFINKCMNKFENKYDYSLVKYSGTNSIVKIICPEHGIVERKACYFLKSGCYKCNMFLSNIEFIERSKNKHNSKYDYTKIAYKKSKEKVIITCKIHGDFLQKPNSHINGQGCPICGRNSVSEIENKWLDTLDIHSDLRQYKILINGKLFIVDAFDPNTNTVYEFNGDFFHGNPVVYNSYDINPLIHVTYGELYQKTINKESTLIGAGYKVVSIWESDFIKKNKK